jgi:hypothetical protein
MRRASHAVECRQSIAWLACTLFHTDLGNFIVEGENGFPIAATITRTMQSAQITRRGTGHYGQGVFDGSRLECAVVLEHEAA